MFKINDIVLEDLIHYFTARIDFKNMGKLSNQIEFLYISDNNAKLSFPDWFKDENGVGAVIESFEGKLDLKIKCIQDGKLNIKIRGIDVKSKGKRIPIYINYKSFIINGVPQINENKLVSYDDNYEFNVKVYDRDILFMHIESSPFII